MFLVYYHKERDDSIILTSIRTCGMRFSLVFSILGGIVTKKGFQDKAPQEVIIKSTDDASLYACLQMPPGDGPFPAVIFIHGGYGGNPEYTRALIDWNVARLLFREGFVVVSTDYRHDLEGKDIYDIVAAFEYVSDLPYVEHDKIVYFGDSHGSYLAMMAATRISPFAIIHGWGVTDMAEWFEYIKKSSIPVYQRIAEDLRKSLGGEPQDIPEVYRQVSPITQLGRIKCPVLILHGEDDEDVPVAQAYKLAQALKKAGKEYELRIFKNERHGLRSPEARQTMEKTVLEFIKKHLKE
jgi:dipeptidyl aminopeptidase/acylaminoacyl peptidase